MRGIGRGMRPGTCTMGSTRASARHDLDQAEWTQGTGGRAVPRPLRPVSSADVRQADAR